MWNPVRTMRDMPGEALLLGIAAIAVAVAGYTGCLKRAPPGPAAELRGHETG